MKKIISVVLAILLICTMLPMTGCTSAAEVNDPIAFALVGGNRANNPSLNFKLERVDKSILAGASAPGSRMYAIPADGAPSIASSFVIPEYTKDFNATKKRQISVGNKQQIVKAWSSACVAKAPEADLLRAIAIAANSLCESGCEDKMLFIFDSGISTTGLVNFASNDLINASPDDIVSQLKELHSLPDLTNIHVIWMALGQTTGSQQTPSDNFVYKLEQIWRTILVAAGAKTIDIDKTAVNTTVTKDNLPYVTPVPIPDVQLDVSKVSFDKPIAFTENTSVRFQPDKAILIDETKAVEALVPIAKAIQQQKIRVAVIGTTADDGNGNGIDLSRLRAEVVATILIEHGVSAEDLVVIGIGCTRWSQTSENASDNRAVYIINANKAIAQEAYHIETNFRHST